MFKKYLIVLLLLCSLFFIPVVVKADNSSDIDSVKTELIALLTQLIAQLQQQINDILASQATLQNNFNQLQDTVNQAQIVNPTPPETPINGTTIPNEIQHHPQSIVVPMGV
ncbi:MAG: hypothetical protein NT155_03740 [Candidatus Staskawiczbacteria bacterium]|nr:hypothetical protein [Candidatus Staskawiczbacteria bacterium]